MNALNYDRVRFLAVQDFLALPQQAHWPEHPPAQLREETDRRFYWHLFQGMVRHRRLLEAEIAKRLHGKLHQLPGAVRGILSAGLYQLIFMDQVPAHAALYETVQLAQPFRVPNQKGLINAVLRRFLREVAEGYDYRQSLPLAIATSHPDWMVTRWQNFYSPEQVQQICWANHEFEGVHLRVEPPWTRESALAELAQAGINAQPHPLATQAISTEQAAAIVKTPLFTQGGLYVQDASTQIFLEMIAPLGHGKILDVCAAPGGKSLGWMRSPAVSLLVMNDPAWARMAQVRQNLERLHLDSAALTVADGRALPFREKFDLIWLDVPCASTGTIRKHPELKWLESVEVLLRKVPLQAQLLESAVGHLKEGGKLIYSTCSLEHEENAGQVQSFLAHHPEFRLWPCQSLSNLSPEHQALLTPEGYYQALPCANHMGFFAAILTHV